MKPIAVHRLRNRVNSKFEVSGARRPRLALAAKPEIPAREMVDEREEPQGVPVRDRVVARRRGAVVVHAIPRANRSESPPKDQHGTDQARNVGDGGARL